MMGIGVGDRWGLGWGTDGCRGVGVGDRWG